MKKIHLQVWMPVTKVAEVAKAMHEKGFYFVKPADILRFCFDAARSTLEASQLSEDEAFQFLQRVGYFRSEEEQRTHAFLKAVQKKDIARTELEELIERVGRSPSTSPEIKEMLNVTPVPEVSEVDS